MMILPAHNEQNVIGNLIESLKNLDYPDELYDLRHDPDEMFNLLEENRFFLYGPEFIENQKQNLLAEMESFYEKYATQINDGKNKQNSVAPGGTNTCLYKVGDLLHGKSSKESADNGQKNETHCRQCLFPKDHVHHDNNNTKSYCR